jgi:hypothetical protein
MQQLEKNTSAGWVVVLVPDVIQGVPVIHSSAAVAAVCLGG